MTAIERYDPASSYAIIPSAASLAEQIARTDFAPQALRGKPDAVMAAMLQGHELGIGPMASLAEIAVINGRPSLSAKLMRALVQQAGHDLWFEVKTNTRVTICGRRRGWPEDRVQKVTWTMDDAGKAGLSGGQNYRKFPRQMLAARATGELCRDIFADVLGGVSYTPEELTDGDLVADGDLIAESRDDVVAEVPTTKRKARGRTAAKTSEVPVAPAPEPVAEELPPLPGEDETPTDEDVVDAVIVEDLPPLPEGDLTPERVGEIKALIARLDPESRADLRGWWAGNRLPALDSGDLTAEQADEIEKAIRTYPGMDDGAARNKRMWALVAEAWPDDDTETRDRKRKALIGTLSNGATESSKGLCDADWEMLFDSLDVIKDGSHELFLRSSGGYELRRKGGAK